MLFLQVPQKYRKLFIQLVSTISAPGVVGAVFGGRKDRYLSEILLSVFLSCILLQRLLNICVNTGIRFLLEILTLS